MPTPALGAQARRAVVRFDAAVDEVFERRLRGHRPVDVVMYAASAAADHSALWVALALAQHGRRRAAGDRSVRPLVRAVAGISLESALVNGPIKLAFRRARPAVSGARPLHLRQPRTSSFPSGHASAAFCAAALLGEGDRLEPLYYLAAVVVASSRVHVRIHHGSDVVAGAVTGMALGALGRRLAPLAPLAPLTGRPAPCR